MSTTAVDLALSLAILAAFPAAADVTYHRFGNSIVGSGRGPVASGPGSSRNGAIHTV